jgi:predicted nucleotidyltransferase
LKVLGIITEYNPFHNGHKFHIEQAKKLSGCDYVICVMSGNFIQRGEPALLNKWARTKMALTNGVDLVIELPVSYVLQSAEHFAFGAVKILNSLGIVDYICFGSEHGDINPLTKIAQILVKEPEYISGLIKHNMHIGDSYARAREKAVISYLKEFNDLSYMSDFSGIISSPNNILGIEYIKALQALKSKIIPLTIKRFKAGYNDLKSYDNIASATAIRSILENHKYSTNTNDASDYDSIEKLLPPSSFYILNDELKIGQGPIFTKHFDTTIISLIRKMGREQLALYPDVNEGLQNRIIEAVNSCGSIKDAVHRIKTKRYTYTRLMRIMFNALIGIDKASFDEFQSYGGPQYIRVLGMNKSGQKLLKSAHGKVNLPIIVKPSSYKQSCNPLLIKMIELDFLATDLYTLSFDNPKLRTGKLDLTTSPIII